MMMPARMDNHASTLGGLLRDARERLGRGTGARVRQADVAEHVDITVEWYARIERGTVLPSFDVLSRIATVLELSSQERVEALRFVVPELFVRDTEEAIDVTGRASRELRAYRRFHRRAESASTLHELVDMAVSTVMDGLPNVSFSGFMSKSVTHDRWRHRSVVRPDLADAVNAFARSSGQHRASLGIRRSRSADRQLSRVLPQRARSSEHGPYSLLGECRQHTGAQHARLEIHDRRAAGDRYGKRGSLEATP
jgi:transcriptional regulator with XRE-family HTH domain